MTSVERLRELFDLREDGMLVRKVSRGGEKVGTVARGCPDGKGYLTIRVDRKALMYHRVVFALYHGRWPQGLIDHIDRDPNNNHPGNLREASKSQNSVNSGTRADNSSGYRGVSYNRTNKCWYAEVSAGGKRVFRKPFKRARDAAEACILESLEHHGEFSPYWGGRA